MYISLRESRKNGFKQWSDSHGSKYGRGCDAEEGPGIAAPGSAFASPGMTVPSHPSLLAAESGL